MSLEQAVPAKKVKLEINAAQADILREKGQAFIDALRGKVIKPDDSVVFGSMIMDVKATKPKGAVMIDKKTAVKMSITKNPVEINCPECGQAHQQPVETCSQCGARMDMVTL